MKWRYFTVYRGIAKDSEIGYLYGASDNSKFTPDKKTQNDGKERKLACFDLDQTLIDTKSGYKFPKDAQDWRWKYCNVKTKLNSYFDKGFDIVIITNQAGIKSSVVKMNEFKTKIETIEKDLTDTYPLLSFEIYCAPHKDVFRKPYPTLLEDLKIDRRYSFFCGDGAGRSPIDHTSSDIKFAHNLNLTFHTPEYLFLGVESSFGILDYPIQPYTSENIKNKTTSVYNYARIDDTHPELIIMVGFPASGKSTIAREIKRISDTEGYEMTYISLDQIGSKSKMLKAIKTAAGIGSSMIIDNTNIDLANRKELIDTVIAIDDTYIVRIIHVCTSIDRCKHNNCYRYYINYKDGQQCIPDIAYRIMKSKFITPIKQEHKKIHSVETVEGGIPYDKRYEYYYF